MKSKRCLLWVTGGLFLLQECLACFVFQNNNYNIQKPRICCLAFTSLQNHHRRIENVESQQQQPQDPPPPPFQEEEDDDTDKVSNSHTLTPPPPPRRRVFLSSLLASSLLTAAVTTLQPTYEARAAVDDDDTVVQDLAVVEDAVILSRSTSSNSNSRSSASTSSNSLLCDDAEARRIEIFERTAPSVVFIDTFTEQRDIFSTNVMEVPLGSGSGFVWDDQGHIVTNFHVVRNANAAQVAILTTKDAATNKNRKSLVVAPSRGSTSREDDSNTTPKINPFTSMRGNSSPPFSNAKRSVYSAKVVGVDPSKDIAVLKVDAPRDELFPIAVGTSTGLRVGQQSLAIGNPFGLDHTLTAGIISGIGREVKSPTGRPISNVIQTDAAINPGNSGGPLLDSQGKLIGMNTAIYSPSGASAGIGFAIPVDTVKYIVETLIRDGKVVRPILGISLLESKQAQALGINSGVLVLEVPKESPAYKAGMRGTRRTETGLIELGDIITKVGDVTITTEADLFKAVEVYKPGDRVKVTVVRVEPGGDDQVNMKELVLTIQLIASSDFALADPNKLVYPGGR